jgi:hypothetical protein
MNLPVPLSFELLPIPLSVSSEWDRLQHDRYTEWMAEEVAEAYGEFINYLSEQEIDMEEIKDFFYDGLIKNVPAEVLFCEFSGEKPLS